jgi:hypothetical protein
MFEIPVPMVAPVFGRPCDLCNWNKRNGQNLQPAAAGIGVAMDFGVILLIFLFAAAGVFVGYIWGAADGRAVLEEYKHQSREMNDE